MMPRGGPPVRRVCDDARAALTLLNVASDDDRHDPEVPARSPRQIA